MSRETDPMMIHEYRKVMARQIAFDLFERAYEDLNWEDYPELGEYDWEAIVDMVANRGPSAPDNYQYVEAWQGLTGEDA